MESQYRGMLYIVAITWVACNLFGGCKADTISDACKAAKNQQFCTTSLTTAMGGTSTDLKKISATAVDLTNLEANRVASQIRSSDPLLNNCAELLGSTASEMNKVESKLKGMNGGNFQTVISDVQNGLNNVDSNLDECYVNLKESGNADLIPKVTAAAETLSMLANDAQSAVYYLSKQGLLP